MELDTDVLIIGAGISGLGFAVQLVRKYGTRNFEIIEKTNQLGGTWSANTYPGCGVDVVAHYYSYSFCLNPDWTHKYPLQPEILAYFESVAAKYDIERHIKFRSVVQSSHWDASSGTWLVSIKDLETLETRNRRCKILVSAVGVLSVPNECQIPGASSFQGPLFHTARWDHSFDWKDKELVVIGNGCSASQAVPALSSGENAAKMVTQFARQPQWVFERPNPEFSSWFKWTMRWVPFAMRIYRGVSNYWAEWDFQSFDTVKGAGIRKMYADYQGAYIRRTAPERYHGFLIPKIEVGCKRRVMDTDYLECLGRDNVELVCQDSIEEIVEGGVRTKSGRLVKADAIILANGFQVERPLVSLNLYGEDGISVAEHWNKFSDGSASSYFGTCLSGFPNFFIMMGPNTASGHASVTYTTECQINFALRVMKPVMKALQSQRSYLPVIGYKSDVVQVKPEAEQADIDIVREKVQKLVWSSGCSSWALDSRGRNTVMYPDFQYKFWLRSIFIDWRDFQVSKSGSYSKASVSDSSKAGVWLVAPALIGAVAWVLSKSITLFN